MRAGSRGCQGAGFEPPGTFAGKEMTYENNALANETLYRPHICTSYNATLHRPRLFISENANPSRETQRLRRQVPAP
ncbi:hypothetical protein GCM10011513_09910 [Franconibacter daqui]|nr:hypothetical protein GCM10011513_09910 [Franconibacter daqui]